MNYSRPLVAQHNLVNRYKKQFFTLKEQGKIKKTFSEFIEELCKRIPEDALEHIPKEEQDLSFPLMKQLYGFVLEHEFIQKDIVSIYLEERKLKDFLISTECIKDFNAVREYIIKTGQQLEYFNTTTKITENWNYLIIHFRIPDESFSLTYLICTYISEDLPTLQIFHVNEEQLKLTCMSLEQTKVEDNEYHLKFILNFIYYVLTFPDALVEGKPKNIKPDKYNKNTKKFILKTNNKILDIEKNKQSRVTHFRKGHFRHLTSDWYKEKKGQWIFVNGSIVRGCPAKTLL